MIPDPQWYKEYNLLIFDEIDSTNTEAKRLVHAKVAGNFVIWSKTQSAGHGRYGREWVSPEGNLYFSLLMQEQHPLNKASQLVFVTAIAIGEAIRPLLPPSVTLSYKWPNDILLNGKKVAGILLETEVPSHSTSIDWVVIGVGVNMVHFPEIASYAATALLPEGGRPITVDQLLDISLGCFAYWVNRWKDEGFDCIRTAWLGSAANLGKVITACKGTERIAGVFEAISEEGNLVLKLAGGQTYVMSAGEVFFQQENEIEKR